MRTYGGYYKPRTKKEFIYIIIKSGKWHDTQTKLRAMDIKQIAAIYHRIRQEQMNIVMNKYIKKQSVETA